MILKTSKKECSFKKEKEKKKKLLQMPEMISLLSWRVISTGDAGMMGVLFWSLYV